MYSFNFPRAAGVLCLSVPGFHGVFAATGVIKATLLNNAARLSIKLPLRSSLATIFCSFVRGGQIKTAEGFTLTFLDAAGASVSLRAGVRAPVGIIGPRHI